MVKTGYGLHLQMTNRLQNWLNYKVRPNSDRRVIIDYWKGYCNIDADLELVILSRSDRIHFVL